jgi:hypothetical protein
MPLVIRLSYPLKGARKKIQKDLLSILKSGSPFTGRVHAKSHPFKKMKREIAAVVVLCAACVEGASRLNGHKGKHTLT